MIINIDYILILLIFIFLLYLVINLSQEVLMEKIEIKN